MTDAGEATLYRNLKTVREVAEEGPFTADQWWSIASRPERDPELAACIIRFSKRRVYIDVARLDQVLESRRLSTGPKEVST